MTCTVRCEDFASAKDTYGVMDFVNVVSPRPRKPRMRIAPAQ